MSRLRPHKSNDHGAAAVEFALILPILVLLLFGIIWFGMAFWQFQGMQAAAREGARLASISASASDIDEDAVVDRTEAALQGVPGESSVTVSDLCSEDPDDGTVLVEVTDTVDLPIPFWGPVDIPITAHGEFRCEG